MFISYCSSVLCSSDLGRDQGQGAQLAIAVAVGNARHQFGSQPLGLAAVAVGIDVPEIVRRPLAVPVGADLGGGLDHPVEHDEIGRATSELQSLMRISYAVFCLKKKTTQNRTTNKD